MSNVEDQEERLNYTRVTSADIYPFAISSHLDSAISHLKFQDVTPANLLARRIWYEEILYSRF
ncbi:hypothetical protein BCON_0455g00010 [Botryotinia convoluta]|uniref:Uncharacterized protein n=1 Tax=Botryotinia convoluta TaxID=54673 RepID=A0A4Z1H6W3_9HELO|nr:hypothetical protein BCON_0455g00010 [Botryotinia convoluta]